MANRVITAYCADETMQLSSSIAGAAGSSNAVTLRLSFSSVWDGTTKKVYFYDATKAQSVCIICTTDKIVSGEADMYDIPIPAEALDVAGKLLLTVKGVVVSGTTAERVMVSATATMDVLEADIPSGDNTPAEPNATQSEQLQSEINGIKGDIATVVANASTIASSASAASASASAAAASQSAAASSATAAAASQAAVKTSETNAASSESTATAKAGEASISASVAKTSETNAAASAGTATTKADAAAASASAAKTSETNAKTSETNAANSAAVASASQSSAASSASAAATSETNAAASATAAANSAAQAAQIVGGDFATKADAQGYATTAKSEAVSAAASDAAAKANAAQAAAQTYTDNKIAAIPAPDMSTKADKKVPSAEGNFASLDASGNLADSGKKPADFAAAAHASNHKTGGSDALTPGDIGAATRLSGTATLSTSSWVGGSAPYIYTLSVPGIKATDTPHIDRVTGTDASAAALINTAWGLIAGYAVKPQTAAGTIIFYASAIPSVAIPIMYEVVRA